MTVRELWSRKGVVIVFEKAGRDEEVLLSIASLAAAVAFVGLTTLVAARRGRSEISVLHSLGWPAPHLWALIDGEVALMGAIATAAAAVVTTTVATFWKVSLEAGLVMPGLIVGGFMAPIAAAIPALAAARDSAQRTDGRLRTVRGSQVPGSLAALALRDLIDRPIPMSLGVGAICVSSITLGTLVLVATAFNGSLDATVLGAHLRAQVEPYHLALAVGGLVIATAAAGQVVALGYVDRIPEFATLRALGWPRSAIGRILMTQIAGMWALAATISTTALAGFGLAMAVFPEGTALAVGASLGASAIAAGLAVLPTILEVFRTSPARVLRGQ